MHRDVSTFFIGDEKHPKSKKPFLKPLLTPRTRNLVARLSPGPCNGFWLDPDLSSTLFSGGYYDLTGDERTHFTLYRRRQIGTGLRYMEGYDGVVACSSI